MTAPPISNGRHQDVTSFCCALYAAPEVSRTAIMLQDALGVDVNLLLFACWAAGFAGGTMTHDDIEELLTATVPLQDGTIGRIRTERRAIPKGSEREAERQQLLALELAAEKAELGLLQDLWRGRANAPLTARSPIEDGALANLQLYLAHVGTSIDDEALAGLTRMARFAAQIHLAEPEQD